MCYAFDAFKPFDMLFRQTILSLSFLLMLATTMHAQDADSIKTVRHFSGSITVTNNGISFIPTFSLGKPASIFNFSLGSDKFSFEPELRFDLEGHPWSFLFWARYKMKPNKKWRINLGMHPALNFRTEIDSSNGVIKENVVTRRYLASEFAPNYFFTKNISVGLYYLYSRGLDAGTIKYTHFLTINSTFSNVKLSQKLLMKFTPQFFYLNLEGQEGFYCSESTTLSLADFPISLNAIFNKTIQSNITANKDFVWNLSLIYSFNKKYQQM
jgi:hypothetical protein